MSQRRAQLVLAAAAVVAIALAPAVIAYVQLGYHPDVRASSDYTAPAENANRVLERAVRHAETEVRGEYGWNARGEAVADVRDRLGPRLAELEAARVEEGTVYQVAYNESIADARADEQCPQGAGRAFGSCETIDGVVVQDRIGETHVVAVAFDVRVTTDRGWIRETVVIDVDG